MAIRGGALDRYVAPEISALTECSSEPIGPEFPNAEAWLRQFTATSLFQREMPREVVSSAFSVMRRAHWAMRSFDEGVGGVRTFLSKRSLVAYFVALDAFEAATSNAHQGLVSVGKLVDEPLFEQDHRSDLERMNRVSSTVRFDDPEKTPAAERSHAVWLKNDGLHTAGDAVTFDELRRWTRMLCSISDHMARGERASPNVGPWVADGVIEQPRF